jgi:D-alanyl-D-alanine carboxypeptidase (penicillin-binding protein 5/6)
MNPRLKWYCLNLQLNLKLIFQAQSQLHKRQRMIKNVFQFILFCSLILIFPSYTPGKTGEGELWSNATIKTQFNEEESIRMDIRPELAYKPENIRAGLVFDVNENKIVWAKGLTNKCNIASLTKMMVALITLEDIENGRLKWDSLVSVTKEASWIGGSKVYLNPGKKVTIEELLNAAMIASGNDAAYMLAQLNAGSEAKFVQRMNLKAFDLGMFGTKFYNSTGLPVGKGHEDNYSSPADLLVLAKELLEHEEILSITKKKMESLHNGRSLFVYENKNKLVSTYAEEVDGLKTGFTRSAMFCLCATSHRCDYRVITIVLGVESGWLRNQIVTNLFNNYYNSIGLGQLGECTDPTAEAALPVSTEE